MHEKQKETVALFTDIVPHETSLVTSTKGLFLFRIEHSFPRTPYSYNSEIIILAQGEKRVYLGNDVFTYLYVTKLFDPRMARGSSFILLFLQEKEEDDDPGHIRAKRI